MCKYILVCNNLMAPLNIYFMLVIFIILWHSPCSIVMLVATLVLLRTDIIRREIEKYLHLLILQNLVAQDLVIPLVFR